MKNKIKTTILGVKLLNEHAKLPEFKTEGSAGFDLYTTDEDTLIMPGETVMIGTGLAFEIPEGYQIEVRNRSGISAKTKLRVANSPGTVDSDYRGEVSIIIDNIGTEDAIIERGTRLAQGVLAIVPPSTFELVDELGDTVRGDKGFGHSGTK